MPPIKPYLTIPITECGEVLQPIPPGRFALTDPHPYAAVGAPYGGASPWMLREGVLAALNRAAERLEVLRPGWRLQLFDAYRPVAVQSYMVEHTLAEQAALAGLDHRALTPQQRGDLLEIVYGIWAVPRTDPATPPPHSTGAAVDLTLQDGDGNAVPMGGEIDDIAPHSAPDYWVGHAAPQAQKFHNNRLLLNDIMLNSGFRRHPAEWWHFSLGDQFWIWLGQEAGTGAEQPEAARYGRADLLPAS